MAWKYAVKAADDSGNERYITATKTKEEAERFIKDHLPDYPQFVSATVEEREEVVS